MKQNLRLRGALCPLRNQYKNSRATALKLFALSFPLTILLFCVCLAHAQSRETGTMGVALQDTLKNKEPTILKDTVFQLQAVEVNTGYQVLPRERATGSFVQIDSALFNRTVSRNVIDRLDGITSGLIGKTNNKGPRLTIRGRSTIFGNAEPLIVVDNFPYDGDIDNLNPQDVASITILKDAAAASIWGARAGNGVIVITTRKGEFNQKPQVSVNTNLTVTGKPDLYYLPQLTNQQYIEIEKFLFDKGKFNSTINNGWAVLSPVVEVLLQHRNGSIADADMNNMLASIGDYDVRSDLEKYYYRVGTQQQYQFNISGGSKGNRYYISLGYDKNLPNQVTTSDDRLTINTNNTLSLLNDRLTLQTGLVFSINTTDNNLANFTPRYPYERIAGDAGEALSVARTLRAGYVDTVGAGKLLDWHYRPLDELRSDNGAGHTSLNDYRMNLGINYKILPALTAGLNYTYQRGMTRSEELHGVDTYYTRDLINRYSYMNDDGALVRPLPYGGIRYDANTDYRAHYFRGQLNFDKIWDNLHHVNILAGYELKDYQRKYGTVALYGYDPQTATNLNSAINFNEDHAYYYSSSSSKIPAVINNSFQIDRYRSVYANASYTYANRYTLSASARKDESNLFGVNANQKGVPLWSTGIAWDIFKEGFYNLGWLPYLKLRMTYGYNGNVDKSTSAYLTAEVWPSANQWGSRYLVVGNPPNASLRWEKVKNINWGLDFSLKKNILSGSLEYWVKNGQDLIGNSAISPQTGITTYRGNTADVLSRGVDVNLTSTNIANTNFQWHTNLLFNYQKGKVTSYRGLPVSNWDVILIGYNNPVEGYPYYALFSYAYHGLDEEGNPIGQLNGEPSKDYSSIFNNNKLDDLVYTGSAVPIYFGALRNTFNWKGAELSFNITYKFDYYFRRSSLDGAALYSGNYGSGTYQMPDYDLRWQKPGDENKTNIPALVYPVNSYRNNLYMYSEVLVEKGDHIRLQDIKISYTFTQKENRQLPISNLQVYAYASNLAILWKATHIKTDPDNANNIPNPTTYAFGLKANF
ncbi:SusC/RagA family TonB-linked outer membrane protein [Olivibacter ginsenosidimutans]